MDELKTPYDVLTPDVVVPPRGEVQVSVRVNKVFRVDRAERADGIDYGRFVATALQVAHVDQWHPMRKHRPYATSHLFKHLRREVDKEPRFLDDLSEEAIPLDVLKAGDEIAITVRNEGPEEAVFAIRLSGVTAR